ncbi:SMC-Scp complex subunit ScpB [Patescibacteria group bacterium]
MLSKHLEAILFLAGEPQKVSQLAEILECKKEEVLEAIIELEKNIENRGIVLLKDGEKIMLGTSKESSVYCEKIAKEELNKNLGKAGLEVLAIILYNDGASRPEIDYVRGVNSTFTLRSLLIRGLINKKPSPKNKRGYFYTPSIELLQFLGISKKEDLPNFEELKQNIKNAIESI